MIVSFLGANSGYMCDYRPLTETHLDSKVDESKSTYEWVNLFFLKTAPLGSVCGLVGLHVNNSLLLSGLWN